MHGERRRNKGEGPTIPAEHAGTVPVGHERPTRSPLSPPAVKTPPACLHMASHGQPSAGNTALTVLEKSTSAVLVRGTHLPLCSSQTSWETLTEPVSPPRSPPSFPTTPVFAPGTCRARNTGRACRVAIETQGHDRDRLTHRHFDLFTLGLWGGVRRDDA